MNESITGFVGLDVHATSTSISYAAAGRSKPSYARDEAIRDLSRARIDAVRARLKARQQLKALLLRHGLRYSGKTSWTAAHERYLSTLTFEHPAQDIAFTEYRQAVAESQAHVDRLTAALAQQVEQWRMGPLVSALMTLRGLHQNTVCVSTARELAGFIWAIGQQVTPRA